MFNIFFLVLSFFLLFLVGGMAWMARGFQGYPEQKIVGMVSWGFYVLATFSMFKIVGISLHVATIPIFIVSIVGYFMPEIEAFLIRRFKDPGVAQIAPKTPTE